MSALLMDARALWRARALVAVMTRREISARYAGAAGGIAWAYVQPLLTVAAYFLVFDVVFAMRLGENAPTHRVGAYLIVGSLPWMAFCDTIGRTMNSLLDAGSVLQKNALPPVLFVARSALASSVVYAPLILLLAVGYIPSHHFSIALLALLPLLALQLMLCLVLGYLLAILAAALRDTVQVVGFLLSVGIFLSPVLFPMTLFPAAWRWVLYLNPMTPLVLGYQNVLLQGAWPEWTTWAGAGAWWLVATALLALAVRRSREQLVDWL
ncbi:ABC transporter permease [Xylophilus sp. Leaf220]|uniref:ABC transporter permease n=1 Tax=Xylophilus sp. Leaf220 TaxID=1735686 RepID=UPI0006FC6E34|nr:ABC transporter permease [Xylophilus sp. Leaf220]KQM71380.1 ABC transporter [Xylophilus sp. Leaf220]